MKTLVKSLDLNIDGIITDYPDIVKNYLNSKGYK